jgi:hypothetical protein
MGKRPNQPFQLSFNASLKVDFQGSRVTPDGRLILVRELDEHLGLSKLIEQHLTDSRGKNTQLPIGDLLRQSVYSRLAGYEDVNVPERRLELLISEADLKKRLAAWRPDAPHYTRGYGRMYLDHILQAHEGCDFDFLRGRDGESSDPMRRFRNPGV